MAGFSEIRQMTACFTGHRELGEPPGELERRTDAAIRDLYARGVRYFGAGGARGFDALASERVLTLKEELPELSLILVLPFPEQYRQEGNWSREELAQFDHLLLRADKTVTLTGYEGDTLALAATDIPAVGSKPNEGYKEGSWDKEPKAGDTISEDTVYTYTYQEIDRLMELHDADNENSAAEFQCVLKDQGGTCSTPHRHSTFL